MHLHPDGEDPDSDSECDSIDGSKKPQRSSMSKAFRKWFSGSRTKGRYDEQQKKVGMVAGLHDPKNGFIVGHTDGVSDARVQKLRTMQRYHGGPNKERMAYMEAHSPLSRKGQVVGAEQVSIFLTAGKPICIIQKYF